MQSSGVIERVQNLTDITGGVSQISQIIKQ
jgi:hypothetical protein